VGQLKGEALARTSDFAQLTLSCVDPIQWRYEVIRPIVLLRDTTPQQRADETHTHPYTVRRLVRQFQARGMLGLLPHRAEGGGPRGTPRVADAMRQEIHRLKALYEGFHYRELARILFIKFRQPIDHKTVKAIWQASPISPQEQSERWAYHAYPDRTQARLAVVKLHYQGWEKVSISRVLQVSRPTVDAILTRFDREHFAGLADKRRGPKAPRKRWLPVMVQVYHLQKAHPDAGEFRIWSLLARADVSVRTVGRIMALNRLIYEDMPHVRRKGPKPPPQPHPFKARRPHEYWLIDGRPMDFMLEGVTWWSLVLLEGYSRTMLAGVVAPAEATWAALMVLYTACLQYRVPEHLVSDGGGAYTSNAFEAVCQRLAIDHRTITSGAGESWKNLMETHFNIQRRLYDYQFSLAKTPMAFEQRHHAFIQLYNTTAHQGLLREGFDPPIPRHVLGEAKGRLYTAEDLHRQFVHHLFRRTTNRYGCVALHHDHFHVDEGLSQQPVLVWLSGDRLRVTRESIVVAQYLCRYDWRARKVQDIGSPVFYQTRFTSAPGALLPGREQDWRVVYRPRQPRRREPHARFMLQLPLFEEGNAS
jgi:transposase